MEFFEVKSTELFDGCPFDSVGSVLVLPGSPEGK